MKDDDDDDDDDDEWPCDFFFQIRSSFFVLRQKEDTFAYHPAYKRPTDKPGHRSGSENHRVGARKVPIVSWQMS